MMTGDARVLLSLLRGMPRGSDHADRLSRFYGAQASHYDAFRDRLLRGRAELIEMLNPGPGSHVVELGCGTGRNLQFLGSGLDRLRRVDLVDLCAPLLGRARERWRDHANVNVVEADACHWRPDGLVDVVYLSYALTMIPDWQVALVNAISMLRAGGRLGIVDFTLPPHRAPLATSFWKSWFGHDGVHPDARHVALSRCLLPNHTIRHARSRLPWLVWPRAHYFMFVGTKT